MIMTTQMTARLIVTTSGTMLVMPASPLLPAAILVRRTAALLTAILVLWWTAVLIMTAAALRWSVVLALVLGLTILKKI